MPTLAVRVFLVRMAEPVGRCTKQICICRRFWTGKNCGELSTFLIIFHYHPLVIRRLKMPNVSFHRDPLWLIH